MQATETFDGTIRSGPPAVDPASGAGDRRVGALGRGLAAAALLTAAMFAAKVIWPGLEEWTEEAFGHAWLYQGVLALAVFVISAAVPPVRPPRPARVARLVATATVVSAAIILVAAGVMASLE